MQHSNDNIYFIITIDTESDNAWSKPEVIKLENLKEIPRFQDLCEKYKIIPTYLLSYECVTRDEAVSIFKPILDRKKCEIGHHLHVWSTPPFQKKSKTEDVDLEWILSFQYELPDSLFEEKASTLKEAIINNYNVTPTSHRAGRWGIDIRTTRWLANNEFLVDTSIVPFLNSHIERIRKDKKCKLIYDQSGLNSWKIDDKKSLIEIPVTVKIPKYFTNTFLTINNPLYLKTIHKINCGKVLRPNPSYPLTFYPHIINHSIKRKMRIINMMLHSSELAYGCSPFSKTKDSTAFIWNALEKTFQTVNRHKIKSMGASKILSDTPKTTITDMILD